MINSVYSVAPSHFEMVGDYAFKPPPAGRMFFPPTSLYWNGDRQACLGQPAPPPRTAAPAAAMSTKSLELEAELHALRKKHGVALKPVTVPLAEPTDGPMV